ncbi:MAG: hypothetical protein H6R10_616 [Rhodocyclaceae bacterium]|nr:hypothetical protein [Rhodocyclaceae bacterium]
MHRRPDSSAEPSDSAEDRPESSYGFEPAPFVYVKIPKAKRIIDQELARDEAIDQLLREQGIGSVLGWGESLGNIPPDGSRPVPFHRVDVEVSDLALVRAALHEGLPALGVPVGTEIHYNMRQRHLRDIYSSSGWLLEQPTS